ncbi:MAG: exodeoxyribonuclease VII large subunit, partial [Verrucomicrobia bacterium]|nr:exodeoxyribonuclease VII large subunit [Verrucomicrobiota bacterium]
MGEEYIQWDFGDMLLGKSETPPPAKKTRTSSVPKTSEPIGIDASSEPDRKVYTVEELTGEIKFLLEKQFGEVWVSGEVSGLRVQSSGHRYFTLKDAGAQIQCVLFKGTTGVKRSLVEDGKKLILRGELSVYEPRGQYQLIVRELEEAGQGNLAIAFERLKQKLEAEGLFDEERKRPVPAYPRRVGIVTSPTGAALQDILKVLRTPSGRLEVDVILAPNKVQGEGAAEDIVAAIDLLNRYHQTQQRNGQPGLDVILVTRGGGSIEDLW